MKKLEQIHEGDSKRIYATDDKNVLLLMYKDEAVAFGGLKRSRVQGKGGVNNRLTNHFMRMLERSGVSTHYIEEISDEETLVKRLKMVPLEVVVRNIAAGNLCERLGLNPGDRLRKPVLEFHYKSDELGSPMVNEYHIAAMGWANEKTVDDIAAMALRINWLMKAALKDAQLELIDCRLEFGYDAAGTLTLGDEISADSCRFWDTGTHEHLDKDVFRHDMGDAGAVYHELLARVMGE